MTQINSLYFIRGESEYMRVYVYTNGKYRIYTDTGRTYECHENFKEYYKYLRDNGWQKTNWSKYNQIKYNISESEIEKSNARKKFIY